VDAYGSARRLDFEGRGCPVPHDPEAVLRILFGDFLRLPPENERITHHRFTARWRVAPSDPALPSGHLRDTSGPKAE
jgi:hypothetical protein